MNKKDKIILNSIYDKFMNNMHNVENLHYDSNRFSIKYLDKDCQIILDFDGGTISIKFTTNTTTKKYEKMLWFTQYSFYKYLKIKRKFKNKKKMIFQIFLLPLYTVIILLDTKKIELKKLINFMLIINNRNIVNKYLFDMINNPSIVYEIKTKNFLYKSDWIDKKYYYRIENYILFINVIVGFDHVIVGFDHTESMEKFKIINFFFTKNFWKIISLIRRFNKTSKIIKKNLKYKSIEKYAIHISDVVDKNKHLYRNSKIKNLNNL